MEEDANPYEDADGRPPHDAHPVSSSWLSIDSYTQFFDMTETDIIHRILIVLNPAHVAFLTEVRRPDLYGPLWLPASGLFAMWILGDISSLFGSKRFVNNLPNFLAALCLTYLFVFAAPFVFRRFAPGRTIESVSALICLIGYSTVAFVPVAVVGFLVGSRAGTVVAVVGAAVAGAVLFLRLNGNVGAFVPNVVLAAVNGSLVLVTQRLLR
jgi:hypothetical protein